MIDVYSRQTVVKRLPTFIDRTDGIQLYTKSNLYPQIIEVVRDESPTGISCVHALANFIKGAGFEDPAFGELVVNDKGDTMNDILAKLAKDAATYKSEFAVHITVNMLGQFNGIEVWPFRDFRLGLPDEDGETRKVKFNSNWERDPYKEVDNVKRIYTYPMFNPNQEEIQEALEMMGVSYPGQVLYPDEYPLATFDSVLDQMQTQEEIGVFRLGSIQNGLQAGSIFTYPGKFEDETERLKFKQKMNEHKGGRGANSIMVIEDPDGTRKASDLVTNLSIQNLDSIHQFISKDSKDQIVEAFAMPKSILGILPESGMFNRQDVLDSFEYYNNSTEEYRNSISSKFKKIFANWHVPVSGNFKIKPRAYGATSTVAQPTV